MHPPNDPKQQPPAPDPKAPSTPAPAAAAAPAPPAELEIVHNGQKVKLSLQDAVRYAQIGRNDELRRERLKAMETEYKSREPLVKAAAELGELMKSNPAAGRAVMEGYKALREGRATPEQVMAAINGRAPAPAARPAAGESEEAESVAPTSAGADPQIRAMLAAMASKLDNLDERLQQRTLEDTKRTLRGEVESRLDQDDVLKVRPHAKGIVLDRILASVEAGTSLDEATLLESQRMREALSETATAERNRRADGEEMRTVPATAGVPPTRDHQPKIDKGMKIADKWKVTKEAALNYARAATRAAAQGPNQ